MKTMEFIPFYPTSIVNLYQKMDDNDVMTLLVRTIEGGIFEVDIVDDSRSYNFEVTCGCGQGRRNMSPHDVTHYMFWRRFKELSPMPTSLNVE